MSDKNEIEEQIAALAERDDDEIDVGESALLLAALDRPGVSLDRYRDHLGALSEALAAYVKSNDASKAAALRAVIGGEFGYEGDTLTYDDMQNANLMRVIDRRKGLPVALGILFIAGGEKTGWQITGLGFPYYFLVRVDDGARRQVLDPFKGGIAIETAEMRQIIGRMSGGKTELKPEFYAPVPKREVLIRLQNNIKTRAFQAREFGRGAEILYRMLSFAPRYMSLWREVAQVEGQRGNLNDALAAAERYLALTDNEAQRQDAAALIQRLREKRN